MSTSSFYRTDLQKTRIARYIHSLRHPDLLISWITKSTHADEKTKCMDCRSFWLRSFILCIMLAKISSSEYYPFPNHTHRTWETTFHWSHRVLYLFDSAIQRRNYINGIAKQTTDIDWLNKIEHRRKREVDTAIQHWQHRHRHSFSCVWHPG